MLGLAAHDPDRLGLLVSSLSPQLSRAMGPLRPPPSTGCGVSGPERPPCGGALIPVGT